MYESLHLIPNLNKMMEAYTEVEEESVQETQSGECKRKKEMKLEESLPEPLMGESRKKKEKGT